jgi:drug/metabolite transporter (DMT)-like permease
MNMVDQDSSGSRYSGARAGAYGAAAVMFAAVLWAIDGQFLTSQLYHLDVFVTVFLFHAIPFAFMVVPLYIERKELAKLERRDWLAFLLVGALGGALGTIAFVKAIFILIAADSLTPLSIIYLLQKLQPVFAILLAMIILRERPRRSYFALAISALAGSYLITFGFGLPDISRDSPTLLASLYALIAAFSWGAGTTLSKRAIQKVNFRVGTYLRFGVTTLIMIVALLTLGAWDAFAAITPQNWLVFLIIAFTTGGLAIFIYYWGLKRITASASTMCELMLPFTVIIIDYFRHKPLTSVQWFGTFLLLGSVILIAAEQNRIINHK